MPARKKAPPKKKTKSIWQSPFDALPSDMKGLIMNNSLCETELANMAEINQEFYALHEVDAETKRARQLFCGKERLVFNQQSSGQIPPLGASFTLFVNFVAKERGLLTNLNTLRISYLGLQPLFDVFLKKGLKSLPNLKDLFMEFNNINDTLMKYLSGAFGSGALPNLEKLRLYRNHIGDDGVVALANAVAGGALSKLKMLNLAANNISDRGSSALAEAIARGRMASLKTLIIFSGHLGNNVFGVDAKQKLTAACLERGITIH